MRQLLMILALVVGLGGVAHAQSDDIRATIGAQIEAFKADDFDQAFSYASPTIQGLFRTPDNFGGMVRNGYPMVWRPAEVRYLELREVSGALWQMVQITDAAGEVHILDYQMIELENGWKINGVQLLEAAGINA
ncbi:MAG: DUF4864 domain-containing protein [Sedimentitalea sp.]